MLADLDTDLAVVVHLVVLFKATSEVKQVEVERCIYLCLNGASRGLGIAVSHERKCGFLRS